MSLRGRPARATAPRARPGWPRAWRCRHGCTVPRRKARGSSSLRFDAPRTSRQRGKAPSLPARPARSPAHLAGQVMRRQGPGAARALRPQGSTTTSPTRPATTEPPERCRPRRGWGRSSGAGTSRPFGAGILWKAGARGEAVAVMEALGDLRPGPRDARHDHASGVVTCRDRRRAVIAVSKDVVFISPPLRKGRPSRCCARPDHEAPAGRAGCCGSAGSAGARGRPCGRLQLDLGSL